MKEFLMIVIILSIALVLTSCGIDVQQSSNTMPDIAVKAERWNTSIKLVDDPVLSNSYKNGQDLTLRVENLSTTPIVFLENFGISVMTKDGQNWIDIQNNFYNSGSQYLPTKDSYPLGLLVTALPYVSNLSSPITIRIIILGHAEDNEEELLGAYLDISLNP